MKKGKETEGDSVFFGTGKQFYIFVKVGYYPLLSLAGLTFYFIYCLLSFIILFIGYTNVQSYGL